MGVGFTSRLLVALSLLGIYACQVESDFLQAMCRNIIQMCGNRFTPILLVGLVSSEPDVELMCTHAYELRRCAGQCNNILYGDHAAIRGLNQALEYICDESRREEVQEVLVTDCFSDMYNIITKFRGIHRNSRQCLQVDRNAIIHSAGLNATGDSGITDSNMIYCFVFEHLMTCYDENVEEMCGQRVMTFINPIIRMITRETLNGRFPQCFD